MLKIFEWYARIIEVNFQRKQDASELGANTDAKILALNFFFLAYIFFVMLKKEYVFGFEEFPSYTITQKQKTT